jgi:hypothetical protein
MKDLLYQEFVKGFEGEPEISVESRSEHLPPKTIKLWEGFFDSLMVRIKPANGEWTGLALPYHLHEGWNNAPWNVTNLEVVANQWQEIPLEGLSDECVAVHRAISNLFAAALRSSDSVWISRD